MRNFLVSWVSDIKCVFILGMGLCLILLMLAETSKIQLLKKCYSLFLSLNHQFWVMRQDTTNTQCGNYRNLLSHFWQYDNLTATPILREIKFWWIQTVQKCHFWQFRDSEHWILVNFGLESCSNLLKSKFRTSKMAKMTFLDCLNSPKFGFTWNQSGG